MNQNNQGMTVLPEHVRANLAKYSEHEQLTCLECGYVGMMGVAQKTDRVSSKKSLTYLVIALAILVFIDIVLSMKGASILPWWLHAIVGLGVAIFTTGSVKTYECPNCNAALGKK
ncbi:hypothetical protein [Janthinobacterium sp. HLS12-2]|uniref:hypothetical protein n=1 Tax=Janthinobacterium sp. HLS12-2 TaxID=1259324 RepID=UPI003F20DCCB